MLKTHQLNVNGQGVSFKSGADSNALQIIRNQFGLTASRYSCGQEQCGACHVLVDGQSKPSCQLPVDALVGTVTSTGNCASIFERNSA